MEQLNTLKSMKRIDQLKLMCYKLEVVLSIDAWFFLHGTTEGRENIYYFLSLLSKMVTTDSPVLKRGQEYIVKAGQIDSSILGLSKEWELGRKATTRLLEDFSNLGILKVESNPLTSIITMMCVKDWMINKAMQTNPFFSTTVGKFEGVRIHLYNGQQFGILRKSSPRKKSAPKVEQGKNRNEGDETSVENIEIDNTGSMVNSSSEREPEKELKLLPLITETDNKNEYGTSEDKD